MLVLGITIKARPCTHVQCLVSRIIAAAPGPDTAPAAAEAERLENRSKTSVDNGLYQGDIERRKER